MLSSGHDRISVLTRHLRTAEGHDTVQRRQCEAQSDDDKVITADAAAALIPDNSVMTVRRP